MTSFMTGARPKADWTDCVFNFRIKTKETDLNRIHLIISLLDDKIGVDETIGDVVIPLQKDMDKGWVRFSQPVILNGTDSRVGLQGMVRVAAADSDGWVEWRKRTKHSSRSFRQFI